MSKRFGDLVTGTTFKQSEDGLYIYMVTPLVERNGWEYNAVLVTGPNRGDMVRLHDGDNVELEPVAMAPIEC